MTAFKDYLGGRDVKFWDGIARTFSRLTSTGGSLTQNKIGSVVDVLEVYGSGTAYTSTTLNDAAGAVGSNSVVFLLQPGTWVLSSNVTLASNITLQVPRGATLQVAAGKTLTINGTLEAGEYAIFSGTGTVAGTPKIRIKDPTWFSGTETDNLYPSNPFTTWGSASPESAITAPVGSVYLRTTAGSGTTAYYKESGTGNTGWIARTHIGANAIWHAGNDGAGSGLDADTVDGKNPGSVSGIATLDSALKVVETANQADTATTTNNLAMTGEASAESTVSGVVQLNMGTVTAGDRILVMGKIKDFYSVAPTAYKGDILKLSGTATIIIGNSSVEATFPLSIVSDSAVYGVATIVVKVTGSGTLVLSCGPTYSGATITTYLKEIYAFFLKKQ